MDFWEHIDDHGIRKNAYKEMKESPFPLYLYGAGNLAENIWKKLAEHGIKPKGIITDSGKESWNHGKLPVYKYKHHFTTFQKRMTHRTTLVYNEFAQINYKGK